MKTLKIKQYAADGKAKVSTITLLNNCLNAVPQGGFTKKDIELRVRCQRQFTEAIKKETVNLVFEDEDAEKIQAVVASVGWPMWHADILDFLAEVDGMK